MGFLNHITWKLERWEVNGLCKTPVVKEVIWVEVIQSEIMYIDH